MKQTLYMCDRYIEHNGVKYTKDILESMGVNTKIGFNVSQVEGNLYVNGVLVSKRKPKKGLEITLSSLLACSCILASFILAICSIIVTLKSGQ